MKHQQQILHVFQTILKKTERERDESYVSQSVLTLVIH